MSIIAIIVVLIVIGACTYIVKLIPMDETIRKIIYVVFVVAVILWLAESFGLLPAGFGGMRLK